MLLVGLFGCGGSDNAPENKVTQHDGSRLRGVGIIPDIHVAVTFDSIVNGKDIQLNQAVEYLQQQLVE